MLADDGVVTCDESLSFWIGGDCGRGGGTLLILDFLGGCLKLGDWYWSS